MPLNEPRIFTPVPKWVGKKEISRENGRIWFQITPFTKSSFAIEDVERYNQEQENAKKR